MFKLIELIGENNHQFRFLITSLETKNTQINWSGSKTGKSAAIYSTMQLQ